jgi:hypothetical protein
MARGLLRSGLGRLLTWDKSTVFIRARASSTLLVRIVGPSGTSVGYFRHPRQSWYLAVAPLLRPDIASQPRATDDDEAVRPQASDHAA